MRTHRSLPAARLRPLSMRRFLASLLGLLVCGCTAIRPGMTVTTNRPPERPPNVLLVLTDDLGYGELGCYGQTRIKTPNIDALAARGVRFTNAYSASPVCAPSRCCLLTGLHTGHSSIRDNHEVQPEGQMPLSAESVTIASILRDGGYATAAIGKWGLGPPGSSGDPHVHGFDHFFGYNCQRHAHNHCPPWLYRDRERIPLNGNLELAEYKKRGLTTGPVYAPDLMRGEAEEFIRTNRERPWFLMLATPVPHLALQVPEESMAPYRAELPDKPYDGAKGYLPHPTPHAAYAAVVSRMDADVGALLSLVRELGLEGRTLVIFSSDNGPSWVGGTDNEFFNSTAGMRGRKAQLYEGGIRVPLIVSWPGRTKAGSVCNSPCGIWDLFSTIGSAAGLAGKLPTSVDSVDLLPAATGRGPIAPREYLYWEFPADGYWQAVRIGDFKGVRRGLKKNPDAPFELYDLSADPSEQNNIAAQHPDVVRRMNEIAAARVKAALPEWNY